MEKIEYKIDINAPVRTVWETMLSEETYKQWAGKSWPDSFYDGKWEKGEKIQFIGPDGSGTLAEITELKPYKTVVARHVAALQKGGKEDTTSEMAKGWIGTTERYDFKEQNGNTSVLITMEIYPEWRKMFDDGWPAALDELKRISEQQLALK